MTAFRKVTWIWHRLRAMPPEEIAGRMKVKAQEWTATTTLRTLDDFMLGAVDASTMRLPPKDKAPVALREAVKERRTWLFGWKEVPAGDAPNWNLDPLHGVEVPAEVLNHRELPEGADARCVWELARWSEVVRLAQDGWLNDNADALRLAQQWMRDWLEKNPASKSIHWRSALEGAIRLINFCWIDTLIRACGDDGLIAEQDRIAQAFVPMHACWAWRKRSFGSSANNHLIGELAAVVMATRRWPSLAKVICCPERLWPMLEEEVLRQFAEDGGNKEQALHYHLFAWEMAWQAGRVMDGLHGPVLKRLKDAAQFFCDLSLGSWDFGDSDDAQVTPFTLDRRNAEREWRAWMLGEKAGDALAFWLGEAPRVAAPKSGRWITHAESGHAIWRDVAWTARVDASPLGFGTLAAHGHLDAMHVSLWCEGEALVIDPGTGGYYGDAALRAKLAAWEAHNGPVPVCGRSVPMRAGPFLWREHHDVPKMEIVNGICVVRFACDGPFMKRSVQMAGRSARITDEVCGRTAHVVTWQLAPEWELVENLTWRHANGAVITLNIEGDAVQSCEVVQNEVSPRFGQVVQAPAVRVTFTGRLVSTFSR
ncbi:MAG: heparinase II/III-family protein [Verrucomicrobiaceae bacterium]|nr:heparinase II/III-family protein [Verrucomicrobiaceae bacterium]